jgi:adenylate cyclase class IV
MAQETEIKLRIVDPQSFLRELKKLGARRAFAGTGRIHEWNVVFDTPGKTLARRGQLLRIRIESPDGPMKANSGKTSQPALLTFKHPTRAQRQAKSSASGVRSYKVREELELEVSDAPMLTKVFGGLGMRPTFIYEKFRITFTLPKSQRWAEGLLIELDETPIGTFVEFEGPNAAIDRAARMLGYSKSDYIVTNYLRLYLDDCRRRGEHPADMLFRTRKNTRPRKKS